MLPDETVRVRPTRGPLPRNATRIVALRRASRHAARPPSGTRWGRIFGALLLGVGLTTGIALTLVVVVITTTIGVLSVGLPDATRLESLTFSQPTIVYDRSGKVELGRFQHEERRVVAFDDVPRLVLDATTTAEDRTFWDNSGFDTAAIVAAVAQGASGERERGASTITQQLVRARLLPADVVGAGSDRYMRKAKELIQSMRVNDAFPGEPGKERVITAYLNEIFYGHGAYGIAAAAHVYFGITDLAELTPAQAALLAGLPKSPSTLDPYRSAVADEEGRLVVPPTAAAVERRDWVLRGLAGGSRWTTLSDTELREALAEPVVLAGDPSITFRAAHFTWQVRRQLETILGDAETVETGGYRVITTLDWRGQQLAEKWLTASAVVPNVSRKTGDKMLASMKIPKGEQGWIKALRGKDLHNGALVAIDYRTGDVLAYAGSAGYARDSLTSVKFSPKFDVAGDGERQPGSAFKPIIYAAAFDHKALTPGSLLLDVTTEFNPREDWAPRDADQLERGPVLVRKALQYSLNIPAIRALERTGSEAVADTAEKLGLRFMGGRTAFLQAGLAGALGTVEVRPLDLTSAYGALANGGLHLPPRMVLEIRGPDGSVVWKAPDPEGVQAVSPQAAFLVNEILTGNTDPKQNPIWAEKLELRNGKGGSHRQAAVKTGTSNDARDLATYGYLAPPANAKEPGLAVGVWMGNSDHSNPRSREPAISLTAAAPLWRAFMREYSKGLATAKFGSPKGIVKAKIDAWSGGKPGGWTRETTTAMFIAGTQPGAKRAIDPAGLLYSQSCGGWAVDLLKAEVGPASWDADVADWMRRARRGVGVSGQHDSRTAYFWSENSWGGRLVGACAPKKPPKDDEHDRRDKDKDKPGKGHKDPPGGGVPAPPPAP